MAQSALHLISSDCTIQEYIRGTKSQQGNKHWELHGKDKHRNKINMDFTHHLKKPLNELKARIKKP